MTDFKIIVKDIKAEKLSSALDFLGLEYSKGISKQDSFGFLIHGKFQFSTEFSIKHCLRSKRELKAVLRMAGADIGQEKKKYISLTKKAIDLFSRHKIESGDFMPFTDFDRYSDDGRCVRCEGWGCDTCQMTGGY